MGQGPGELRPAGQRGGEQQDALPEMRTELDHIRAEMSETIDAIEAKLTPDQLAHEAGVQVQGQVRSQKARVADGLGGVAEALRQTGHQLQGQELGFVAQYAERAAEQVDGWSQSIRDRDVGEMISAVEQFARRRPAVFVGSAFTLGWLGARFLKSSSRERGSSGDMAG